MERNNREINVERREVKYTQWHDIRDKSGLTSTYLLLHSSSYFCESVSLYLKKRSIITNMIWSNIIDQQKQVNNKNIWKLKVRPLGIGFL